MCAAPIPPPPSDKLLTIVSALTWPVLYGDCEMNIAALLAAFFTFNSDLLPAAYFDMSSWARGPVPAAPGINEILRILLA